jgi:hypothetical protein
MSERDPDRDFPATGVTGRGEMGAISTPEVKIPLHAQGGASNISKIAGLLLPIPSIYSECLLLNKENLLVLWIVVQRSYTLNDI